MRCFLLLFFTILTANAQPASPLDRLVAVDVRNERVSEVLRQVSQQGNFAFSYNPAVVNDTRTVTLRTGRQPVRIVLAQLFEGQNVTWKARGNHVLLLGEGETRKEPTHFFLDGYIIDEQTGQKIPSASIYERTSLASTVSNPYGYYRLKLTRDLPTNARVEVRKRLYVGESVSISTRQSRTVDVRLRALPPPTPVSRRSIETQTGEKAPPSATPPDTIRPPALTTDTVSRDSVRAAAAVSQADTTPSPPTATTILIRSDSAALAPKPTAWDQIQQAFGQAYDVARQLIHRQNLYADTLYRPFQVSLFPFIGTNHTLSNHVINRLSINVFAGTALGVTGLEVGGFINGIRADVRGAQFAGFGNFVGRDVYGFQAAGFINQARDRVQGGQFAGFGNVVGSNFGGIQAAGFFNKVGGNSTHALQAAGFSNKTGGNASRMIQLAGFTNKTRDLNYGLQIAGFVNKARTVRNSLQIALINVADSTNSVPIGLLSFVRENGYRRWEVSANETFPLNLSFRTGVHRLYNLLSVGLKPTDDIGDRVWQAGYGLGTGFRLGRTWTITLEGSGHVVWSSRMSEVFSANSPSLLLRGTPIIEKRFGRLALAGGPSAVFYSLNVSDNALANSRLLIQDTPRVGSLSFMPNGWAGWIGWQVGLRWTN